MKDVGFEHPSSFFLSLLSSLSISSHPLTKFLLSLSSLPFPLFLLASSCFPSFSPLLYLLLSYLYSLLIPSCLPLSLESYPRSRVLQIHKQVVVPPKR